MKPTPASEVNQTSFLQSSFITEVIAKHIFLVEVVLTPRRSLGQQTPLPLETTTEISHALMPLVENYSQRITIGVNPGKRNWLRNGRMTTMKQKITIQAEVSLPVTQVSHGN